MRFSTSVIAAAGLLSTANAAIKGFNYGANFNNNQAKTLVDFEYEFNAAKTLPGTNGWTSARLYTMIQHGTTNTVIEAIQAAINTKTTLLLGLWASAGQSNFDNEIIALKAAIAQFGTAFTDLVEGISVGSEDLYRITPTGIENMSGAGAQPQELINYVQQTRTAIRGTPLDGKPVGHVDTWTVYVNATNNDFISTLDFLGMDAYPYFQTTMANGVGSASQLFFDAYHQTLGAAQGKPVWVTETGWPVSGQTLNQAVPNADNARIYWEDVTCQLVADNINLWYYTLQDVQLGNPSPSFGIKPAGDLQAVQPLFDLSCPADANPRSSVLLPSATTSSCNCMGSSTSAGLPTTRLSAPAPTFTHTITVTRISSSSVSVPIPVSSSRAPAPVPPPNTPLPAPSSIVPVPMPVPAPSSRRSATPSVPTNISPGLQTPLIPPTLIVTVNKNSGSIIAGNGGTAQLSPFLSPVFAFDIGQEHRGKICNLVFYTPPARPFLDLGPIQIRIPGGIRVSLLSTTTAGLDNGLRVNLGPVDIRLNTGTQLGLSLSITPGNQYNVGSMPCPAGQRVAFQVDSLLGLTVDFFQMTSPPLGLFMVPV
ncbi:glycoside hydrolase [Ophiobolus disseminans]|uniref:Probable glucan endo-1,3-beta-glucosidase eglC n=1 Tax=Ophiobolus disseminans TaxID=1469910 RepID=A0A6A6ZZL5_9PLEO|nr:glycoside hydrolase [Ophiobolus disseminans]